MRSNYLVDSGVVPMRVQAAMRSDDINQLLGLEPIFHELIFEDAWRGHVVRYYEMIKYNGIRQALRTFNAESSP